MGKNIDKTFIQSKMLNQSKGPAVHSLRAQADKRAYSQSMREVLENTDHLTIRQMEIAELIVEDGVLTGVKAVSGAIYHCKACLLYTSRAAVPLHHHPDMGFLPVKLDDFAVLAATVRFCRTREI